VVGYGHGRSIQQKRVLKVSLKRKGEDLEVFFLFLSLFFPLFSSRR
jgi:hypothetical protein